MTSKERQKKIKELEAQLEELKNNPEEDQVEFRCKADRAVEGLLEESEYHDADFFLNLEDDDCGTDIAVHFTKATAKRIVAWLQHRLDQVVKQPKHYTWCLVTHPDEEDGHQWFHSLKDARKAYYEHQETGPLSGPKVYQMEPNCDLEQYTDDIWQFLRDCLVYNEAYYADSRSLDNVLEVPESVRDLIDSVLVKNCVVHAYDFLPSCDISELTVGQPPPHVL